jgi:ribosomal protein S18 acetylase RimI-like enzyme
MLNKKPVGAVTYMIRGRECEIVTLNSLKSGKGIGARLVSEVKRVAIETRCARLCVTTTNDNTHALRFYQQQGFSLVTVHRNALQAARRLKKEIPLIGQDGIPLRDELDLEMQL